MHNIKGACITVVGRPTITENCASEHKIVALSKTLVLIALQGPLETSQSLVQGILVATLKKLLNL